MIFIIWDIKCKISKIYVKKKILRSIESSYLKFYEKEFILKINFFVIIFYFLLIVLDYEILFIIMILIFIK